MPSSTLSDRKIEANRRNALLSTGPRTPEGKARSSKNALTHGIFCRDLVLPDEQQEAFNEFLRGMVRSLNPRNTLELQITEQIIADEWRIKRVRAAGTEAISDAIEQSAAGGKAITPGRAMLSAMLDNPVLERLQRYEQQLRNAIYRGLKELRTLRNEEPAGTNDVAAEALEIEPAPPEKQIEPTSPLSSAPATVYIEPAGGSAEPGAGSIMPRAIAEAARAVVASKTIAI